jgi:phospholipid/cholesterol/gamma-HCH transport system substrate-binding protein
MSEFRRHMNVTSAKIKRMSPKAVGLVVTIAVILACASTFQLRKVSSELSSGGTVKAEFSRGYKLQANRSYVRIAGVNVGTVRSVEATDHGSVVVTMKVDNDTMKTLGGKASAAIRSTTLLGGVYYVALAPSGAPGEFTGRTIPVSRTTIPVELGEVLTAVDPSAQRGVQTTVKQLDGTLRSGGRKSLKGLLASAPDTLEPTGAVLSAARGTRPKTDLTDMVTGLRGMAATTTKYRGQLDAIFTDLNRSTKALSDSRVPLAAAISTMPRTLETTRTGLVDLDGTLDRLTETATSLRPTVRQLDTTLGKLDPVLMRARPVVNDARVLLAEARPLVQTLVPTSVKATRAMRNVRGPVLDRVNGSIKKLVLSPWKGTGNYRGGGNSNKFYEELAYLGVNGAKSFQTHDKNGAHGRLMAGIGLQTIGGGPVPMSLEQYFETLGVNRPLGPQNQESAPLQFGLGGKR